MASVAALLTLTAALATASISRGDLASHAQDLQQRIAADNGQISGYRGKLRDLETRLSGIESSLSTQQALLLKFQGQLTAALTRLSTLQAELVRDRKALAAQLVSQYESPSPDVVGVVMEAHGFNDLLEQVDQMRLIASNNVTCSDRWRATGPRSRSRPRASHRPSRASGG